jgi:serine/threonine protein kinase
VHGDLTPESLFVARQPSGQSVVKVMDYGRRRLAAYNEEGHSQVGLPRGWARYLAPEQIGGDDFDQRADVYALGAILYEALSGELPFQDSTGIGILMSQVYDEPTPLRSRERAKDLPDAIETLVMRSLAKNPAERFPSMDELAMIAFDLAR